MTRSANYWADGQWNFYCDLCGRKAKSSDGVKTWDNFQVCKHHKEVRNPQDFLRGIKENMSVPWTRPKGPELDANPHCTTVGRSAVPGAAVPDCMIPGMPLLV